MRWTDLVRGSLTYYWRTNMAVVAGIATAVAVLAGALLVGDSVRGSLRDLVTERLGRTDHVVLSADFFREQLTDDLTSTESFNASFSGAAPLVALPGFASDPASGRRVGQVRIYGVDDRFWQFHSLRPRKLEPGEALVSRALANELNAAPGRVVLVRLQLPSEIPLESLQGRKESTGTTLRVTVSDVVPAPDLGDFSLDAQQGDVRAVFVPLSFVQRELSIRGRVNTILVSVKPDAAVEGSAMALEERLRRLATLGDVGLSVTSIDERGVLAVNSSAGLLTDTQARAALEALERAGMKAQPVFTYLANTLRAGDREIPYSLVTAVDLSTIAPVLPTSQAEPPIVLNEWAARDLEAAPGAAVTMEYYRWEDPGRLVTRESSFRVVAVVPVDAGDRNLAPAYPGISDSPTLGDWDPPFPIDLRRIRPVDEAYWQENRTTPKAFIPLETGQRLWQSRHGALTSIRVAPAVGQPLAEARQRFEQELREHIDPLATGLAVRDVRSSGMAASRGATEFGTYFVYFSFFIVVSALVLAALFFKLGIEHRASEVGLLRAVGFGPGAVRRLFLSEGILLALAGSALGIPGAIAYAALLMTALGSWWLDAVGTEALTLHVSIVSLLAGAVGGIAAAVACIWWTLRSLAAISERSLLAGRIDQTDDGGLPGGDTRRTRRAFMSHFFGGPGHATRRTAVVLAVFGVALLVASATRRIDSAGGFFGAGTLLLASSLCLFAAAFRAPVRHVVDGRGWRAVSRLGLRSTTYRPGRSVLSISVVAAATFILISVDAFRRDVNVTQGDKQSGLGGYALLVETLLPIAHDPNTREGRQVLNLGDLENVTLEPFRLRPGDDASCLNLYAPQNPRIVAPRDGFLDEGRFAFQQSLAVTDAERANPWLLLRRTEPDGAVPVIADANSMTYVLHRRLGEDIVITHGGRQIRLRLVAALRDSIFQGELLMAPGRFVELFPEQEGYRLLLAETPSAQVSAVADRIEDALADFGADATSTAQRLATFHRVENTYLSTFQTLGGLGLLLGTVGLATVMLRNAVERRREMGLLGAVGYQRRHFLMMAAAENALLLTGGLIAGSLCAAVAIAPAVAERGGRMPLTAAGGLLIFAVLVVGLLSSLVATRVVMRAPVVESLKSE
jgi:ABC-type lipoprotein release transport system permease subunit